MYANEVRGTLLVQACSLESEREDCGPMLQNNLPVTDLKHLMSFECKFCIPKILELLL